MSYTVTKHRIFQWMGILLSLGLIAVSYWYFSARAGVKTNTGSVQPQGAGNLDSGLAGYWKLDEGSGTSAADASTNSVTGTLTNGPTWTTGQIGSAVDFDGTDDYITVADTDVLDPTNRSITLSGWFNRDTSTTTDTIIAKRNSTSSSDVGYIVYVDATTDKLVFEIAYHDGAPPEYEYQLTSTSVFTATGWNHFAVVWDRNSSDTTLMYINGKNDAATASGSHTDIGSVNNNVAFRIGAESDAGNPFDGKIDEIRLYTHALSADDITNLYRLTSPTGTDTGLKGYWSFNAQDMSGTTVYDRSGAGNTGTLTGSPTKSIGKSGQAIDFDGTDDYVTVADNNTLDAGDTADLTITGWFNRDTFTTDDTVIAKRNGIISTDTGYLAYIDDATDQIIFEVSDGTDEYSLTSKSTFTNAGWNHFAIVWDQDSAANTEIYVNGVADNATDTGTIGNIGDLSNALAFRAAAESDAGNPFDGKLDEIRIYSRTLSAGEIQSLYGLGQSDKINTSISQPQGTGRLDSGLAGYWKLDDGSGTSATDSSTNASTGTLTNGPTWTTGQIGSAVDFDGTNDYITMGDQSIHEGMAMMALSGWIKMDALPASNYFVITKSSAIGQYRLAISSTGMPTFVVATTNNAWYSSGTTASGTTALTTSAWTHLLGTYDGQYVRLYVNGVLVGAGSQAISGNIVSSTSEFRLSYDSYGNYFNGQIDEVRLYSRALSADEVADLYRLTTPTSVDTGLKGYWSFNAQDMSGTTAYDRSGAGNTGTLTNSPTKTMGKVGQALSFDGTDDYTTVADANSLDITSAISMAVWIKTTDTDSCIMSKTVASTGKCFEVSGNKVYELGVLSSVLYFQTSNGTTANVVSGSATPLLDNQWHHVVGVWDGTTSTNGMKIYIDGVVVYQGTATVTSIQSTSSALTFGGDGGAYDFSGSIDEGRLYNRALSAAEIKSLYDAGADDKMNSAVSQPQGTGRLDSGLAGYWKMDDGSGTSATDNSTNANTGTLTNGPTWTTGQIEGAVDFDGTDDYVTVADTDILDPTDRSITLSGWFNRETFTTTDTVIAKRNSTSSSDAGYIMYVDATTDKLVFEIAYHDGAPPEYEYELTSTSVFTATGWNHFAVVWDRSSSDTTLMYINGKNDAATASGSHTDIGSVNNNVAFRIGAESDAGNPFDGKIDEIRLYTHALSADDITNLYRLTSPTGTDTSLKGYWSFNGQDMLSSTTAADRSGVGNTGTLTGGPTKAIGKLGQALSFDGSNDYVSIPDNASLDIGDTEDLTLSGWFYRDTFTTDDTLIAKRNGIANTDDGYILYIDDSTDKLTFEVSENSGADEYQLESTQTFTSAGWYHFVIVWDQDSAANSEIYVNGIANNATDTGTIGNLGDLGNSVVLAIGAESDVGNPFDGKLDEIRVYKRTLSTSEIQSLYNSSR